MSLQLVLLISTYSEHIIYSFKQIKQTHYDYK